VASGIEVCFQIRPGEFEMGETNGMAIAAMVLGIVGLCVPLCSLIALILGGLSLSNINKSGQGGKGMAITGLVLGIIGVAWRTVYAIIWMIAILGSA
jgi:hypothetical protein